MKDAVKKTLMSTSDIHKPFHNTFALSPDVKKAGYLSFTIHANHNHGNNTLSVVGQLWKVKADNHHELRFIFVLVFKKKLRNCLNFIQIIYRSGLKFIKQRSSYFC